jgi:class 3 adenylate cyclase
MTSTARHSPLAADGGKCLRRTAIRSWPHGGRPDDPELPEGILTFLLTDIEGSTPLWERHRAVMGAALAQHESLVAQVVTAHGGRLIKTRGEGDSTVSVFARASDAAAAALVLQRTLGSTRWPDGLTLLTRAALHTGEAELRDGDYYGQTLNRAARLRRLGQGGQILLSRRRQSWWPTSYPPRRGWSTSVRTNCGGCPDARTSSPWSIPSSPPARRR